MGSINNCARFRKVLWPVGDHCFSISAEYADWLSLENFRELRSFAKHCAANEQAAILQFA